MTFDDPDLSTKISAVFTPQRTDDLKAGVSEYIGQRHDFRFVGHMDWDSAYLGQSQWMPGHGQMQEVAWVVACDLTGVVEK